MAKFDETVSGPDLRGLGGGAGRSESPGPAIAQGVSDLAGIAAQFTQQRRRDRFATELESARAEDMEALAANQAEISALQTGMPTTNEEFLGLGEEGSAAQKAFQDKWDRIRQLEARQPTLANLRQKELIAEFSTRYPLQTNVWQSALQRSSGTSEYLSQLENAAPSREEQYMEQLSKHAKDRGWSQWRTAEYLAGEARWSAGDLNQNEQSLRGIVNDSRFGMGEITKRMQDQISLNELPVDTIIAQHEAELLDYHRKIIRKIQGAEGVSETAREGLLAEAERMQKLNTDIFTVMKNESSARQKVMLEHQTAALNSEIGSRMLDAGMSATHSHFVTLKQEDKASFLDALYQVSVDTSATAAEFLQKLQKAEQVKYTRQAMEGTVTLLNPEDAHTALRLGMQDIWGEIGEEQKDPNKSAEAWTAFRQDAVSVLFPALAKSKEGTLNRAGEECVLSLAHGCADVDGGMNNRKTDKILFQDIERIAVSSEAKKLINESTDMQDQVRSEFSFYANEAASLAKEEGFMISAVTGLPFESKDVEHGSMGLTDLLNSVSPYNVPKTGRIQEVYSLAGGTEYIQFNKGDKSGMFGPVGLPGVTLRVLATADAITESLGVQPGFVHRMGEDVLDVAAEVGAAIAGASETSAAPERLVPEKARKHPSPALQAAIKKLNVYGTLGRHFMSPDELSGIFPDYTGQKGPEEIGPKETEEKKEERVRRYNSETGEFE